MGYKSRTTIIGVLAVLGITLFSWERNRQEVRWVHAEAHGAKIEIPFSSGWKIDGVPVAPYDIEPSTEGESMRFGKPISMGTYVTREYRIRISDVQPIGLLQQFDASCSGDRSVLRTVGGISGVEHSRGGAKGCALGFAFEHDGRAHAIYRVPPIGAPRPQLDAEMARIIASMKPDGQENPERP